MMDQDDVKNMLTDKEKSMIDNDLMEAPKNKVCEETDFL